VLPGQSGTFNCTATNSAVNESATIVFALGVTNASTFSATSDRDSMLCYPSLISHFEEPHVDKKIWILGPVLAFVIVLVGVILAVVCKYNEYALQFYVVRLVAIF